MKTASLNLRAALVSLLILVCFVGAWQLATTGPSIGGASTGMTAEEIESAKMMGKDPGAAKSTGFPPPIEVAKASWGHLSDPFYDNGPNDKGIGIQLAHSLGRVGLGFLLAVLVAVPLGFLIGMSPLMRKAFDPFIQVLKPISPLAWMPLALYTLKDSDVSGIFVIFICSVWPMLINTAFGVASVKREWLNVAGLSHQIFWFKMVRREWLPQPAFLRRPLMLEPLKWCFFAQLSKFRAAWRMVAMFCGA